MKDKENNKIEFSKKQFLTLLKIIYLGNWLANAHRTGEYHDKHIKEYEDMEDYIFSFAKQFGYEEYIDDDDSDKGKYYPNRKFDEEINLYELIQEYDEESFWEELPERLGQRDFHMKYTTEEITKMTQEEKFLKFYECVDEWIGELNENGLENIGLTKIKFPEF